MDPIATWHSSPPGTADATEPETWGSLGRVAPAVGAARIGAVDVTDEELTAQALAAETDAPLDADAVPLWPPQAPGAGMLGAWYMPPARTRHLYGWRRPVVIAIVTTLVLLEALGLCSVFGQVVVG